MNESTLIIGNTLAAIMHSIYYCLFVIYAKKLNNKKLKFIILSIIDYILIQNTIHFKLGTNADLLYVIMFYINLKLLYRNKARVTDLITFIICDALLGLISVITYFIFKINIFSLVIDLIVPIIIVIILRNKLNIIEKFYNKYWNRHKNNKKIKSITVRGFSLCITIFEFLALHFWILYLLFN